MKEGDNKIVKKAIAVIAVLAMVFGMLVCMNAQNTSAEFFGTSVLVSDSGYVTDVAVDSAGNIYVVWEDSGIWCSKSTDGGASFGTAVKVVTASTGSGGPAVAVNGNNVYVVWEETYKIYYAMSNNGGSSFGTKVPVSAADADSTGHVDIAVDSGGTIFVVWDGGDNIYIDISTDGTTFGTDVQVNPTSTVVANPSIAIDNDGNILVVWCGASTGHVSFTKATPGSPFSAPVQVDDSTSGARYPSIGVDADGCIFVAWQDARNVYADIYAAVSSDDGATFGTGVKVNDVATDTDQKFPSLAVHPCGKIFVAWQDNRNGGEDIYFANSTDSGAMFGINTKVMDGMPATYPAYPSLAVGNDTEVYVVGRGSTTSSGKIYFSQAPDATWPSAVADLAASNPTASSLDLTWTAPGDNFALGTATTYDIRYSTSTITDANWATATPVSTPPTPQISGTAEAFTVTNLANDTTYYFAMKTSDEIPNTSPLSNVPSGKTLDDWAPDAVTDLSAGSPTASAVTLTWTAPGDNGNTGTATTYDIRYSETEINDTNWDDATNCTGEPSPSIAGTPETFVVPGLSSGITYYFALKTADERPNWSSLSNCANATTPTNQAPNAPTLTAPANDTWTTDNTPTFTWTFSDPDTGDTQGGYNVTIDDSSDFSMPEHISESTSSVSSYTPTVAIQDGIWYWRVKTKDDKGSWGDYSEYWVIKIDTTAPTGSIQIKDGAAKTNTTAVTLTLSATDATSGVVEMCFSNNGTTYATWETYATSKSWNLTIGDGTKTVYVKYKDNAGNIRGYNDTITLDTTTTKQVTETTTGAEVTAQHTGIGNVAVASASSPGDAPSGKTGIGKFVEVTAPATIWSINWVYIKIPYTTADIPAGADESSLKIYYWTGTEWAVCSDTGVDTVNKFVWANETHLTIFAPMAEKAAEVAPVNWTLYGGIGIVAIVIVIAIALVAAKKKKKPEVPT